MARFKRSRKFIRWMGKNTFDGITNRRLLVGQTRSLKTMWRKSAPCVETISQATKPMGLLGRSFVWVGGFVGVCLSASYFIGALTVFFEVGTFTSLIAAFVGVALTVFSLVYYYVAVLCLLGRLRGDNPILKPLSKIVDAGLKMYEPNAGTNVIAQDSSIREIRKLTDQSSMQGDDR